MNHNSENNEIKELQHALRIIQNKISDCDDKRRGVIRKVFVYISLFLFFPVTQTAYRKLQKQLYYKKHIRS